MVDSFSQTLNNSRSIFWQRLNNLKMKEAFLNVCFFPLYALGWLFGLLVRLIEAAIYHSGRGVGRIWYGLRYLAGLFIVGFKDGREP